MINIGNKLMKIYFMFFSYTPTIMFMQYFMTIIR